LLSIDADYSKYTSSYANCPGGKGYYQTAAVQPLTAEDSGVALKVHALQSGVGTQDSTHQSQTVSDGITVPVGAFVAVVVVCALVVFLVILVIIALIVAMK